MNPRARYPPGIGNGRGANVNANSNFHSRNQQQPQHQQQFVQRNALQTQQGQQYQQQLQHQQHQQWLRRNQTGSGPSENEPHKMVPLDGVIDSSSQDWKSKLKIPAPDTRYKTEMRDLSVYVETGHKASVGLNDLRKLNLSLAAE